MSSIRITETDSPYRHLEEMTISELLLNINTEDQKVAALITPVIPQISALIAAAADKMLAGGRLFYVGAGTSGRLGVLDASECPATFGVPAELVTGIIAGGNVALTQPVEFAEDSAGQGWTDLQLNNISVNDVVIGISASGTTPYVEQALKKCRENGILTGSITANPGSLVSKDSDYPVEIVTGPEFITGSTRMKAGTMQKMVLNMISTSLMIRLGRVDDNKMVNMQLTNEKLVDRGTRMVMEKLGLTDYEKAKEMLLIHGSVKKTIEDATRKKFLNP
jgi:N-acetylmuramic acid 6-phosphate etherase